MRAARIALCIVFIAGAAGAGGPAHASRTETRRYVGADPVSTCLGAGEPGVGGACFEPLPTDTQVSTFVLDDVSGTLVRHGFVFLDAAHNVISRPDGCLWLTSIPHGTAYVLVEVYNAGGLLDETCLGQNGVAVAGSIRVTFSGYRPPPSQRIDTQVYVAGTGTYVDCGPVENGPNVGGACFTPLPGETVVTISGDGLGIDQPLTVRFVTSSGNIDGRYCNTTGPLAIPPGTTRITVWASPFSGPLYTCPGLLAYPVTGAITAAFS